MDRGKELGLLVVHAPQVEEQRDLFAGQEAIKLDICKKVENKHDVVPLDLRLYQLRECVNIRFERQHGCLNQQTRST